MVDLTIIYLNIFIARHSDCGGSVHPAERETLDLQQLHIGVLCALSGTQHLLGGDQLYRVQDGHAHTGQLQALGTG